MTTTVTAGTAGAGKLQAASGAVEKLQRPAAARRTNNPGKTPTNVVGNPREISANGAGDPHETSANVAGDRCETSANLSANRGRETHVREHGSILAGAEKAALVWMARRLPRWINSDHLTALGFAAMLLAGASYALGRVNRLALLGVVAALALNWLGDSLDGTLARVRNQQRPRYGFYVDHVLDLVGTCALLGGLGLSGYMNPLLALAMLAAYLTAAAEEFLATHVRRVFHLSFIGFGPTELRIILSIGTLYLLYRPTVHLGRLGDFRLFDVGGAVAIAGLALKIAVCAFRNGRALYEEERLPQ